MKTKEAKKSSLSYRRLVLNVAVIATICLMNCLAVQATDYLSPFSKKIICYSTVSEATPSSRTLTSNWMADFQHELILRVILQRYEKFNRRIVADSEAAPRPSCDTGRSPNNQVKDSTPPALKVYYEDR